MVATYYLGVKYVTDKRNELGYSRKTTFGHDPRTGRGINAFQSIEIREFMALLGGPVGFALAGHAQQSERAP